MWHIVYLYVITDVSGQHVGSICKGQPVQEECMTVNDGTDVLSGNVGNQLPTYAA
jgi:hypothetical protein